MNVDGVLFFAAQSGRRATLWRTDGTKGGTRLVKNVNLAEPDVIASVLLANVNGTLFFPADDGVHGRELWKSNGTTAGTVMVRDINPGSSLYDGVYDLTGVNSELFFSAGTTSKSFLNPVLWLSDGTNAGTAPVQGQSPNGELGNPPYLTNVNGTLYFTQYGNLWRTDGTAAGTTVILSDPIHDQPSDPGGLTNVNGTLFFVAYDDVYGGALWKSDGTPAGTKRVKVLTNGGYSYYSFANLTAVGSKLFFTAEDYPDPIYGREVWESDGTPDGTHMVVDLSPGFTASYPSNLTNVNGTLYFSAITPANGLSLWKTDGTAAGTIRLHDFNSIASVTPVGNTVFFAADDGVHGSELWTSDGTVAGTVLVKDIAPGTVGSAPSDLVNVNGTLFFAASDSIHGSELWKSNGTPTGTVQVKDINSGADGSYPNNLTNVNGILYFAAYTPLQGTELWQSDGTRAGTKLVQDIYPGAGSSRPSQLTNVAGTLFFIAADPRNGTGLWKLTPTHRPPPKSMELLGVIDALFGGQDRFGVGAFSETLTALVVRPQQSAAAEPVQGEHAGRALDELQSELNGRSLLLPRTGLDSMEGLKADDADLLSQVVLKLLPRQEMTRSPGAEKKR